MKKFSSFFGKKKRDKTRSKSKSRESIDMSSVKIPKHQYNSMTVHKPPSSTPSEPKEPKSSGSKLKR